MPKFHNGLTYWRDGTKHIFIGDEDGEFITNIPADRGELGARIWIEGFINGKSYGTIVGRNDKARELRKALGLED